MKKLLVFLLAAVMLLGATACGGDGAGKKERKRATAGQSTVTGNTTPTEEVELDTGLLKPLDQTYAKSNKANLTYDPNVFLELSNKGSDKINIACVGDSITLGSRTDEEDEQIELETSYPAQLQKMLNKRFGNKYEVSNYAHSGAYIADFGRSNANTLRYCNTDEYIKLRKDKPEVVILMLGTNDIGYIDDGEACAELEKAYTDLIKNIKSLKSKPVVFVCTPLVRMTSYSSYLALDALNNAIIRSANNAGAYVIDTYNITKEYFESALYETDGLHPDTKGYEYLASTVMNAVAEGLTEYKAGTVENTDDYVVYVDSRKGTYESVGASPDKPTSNLARAIDLCRGGGTIVVSGPINPAKTGSNTTRVFIAPENTRKIKITSVYGGVDYRTAGNGSAKIILSAGTYLNGDFEFENVDFEADYSALKFVCNYNNVTLGKGVSCSVASGGHSVLIFGHDVVSLWQTADKISCNENCTLTVNSGTFTYLRGGNHRTYNDEVSKLAYGTVKSGVTANIIINGGTFAKEDSDNNFGGASGSLSSAIGLNGMEKGSTVNLTINGGKIAGSLFAVPRLNPYPSTGAPNVAGDINITVNDGVIGGRGINYQQRFKGDKLPSVTGNYTLTINSDPFTTASKLSLSAEGAGNSTLTLAASCIDIADWAESTISTFKTVVK